MSFKRKLPNSGRPSDASLSFNERIMMRSSGHHHVEEQDENDSVGEDDDVAAENDDDDEDDEEFGSDEDEDENQPEEEVTQGKKKKNRNAPTEQSSKIPVARYVPPTAAHVGKIHRPRDPRFDPLCGSLDKTQFKKSFEFIDQMKSTELSKMRKDFQKTNDEEKKRQLQGVMTQYQQELKASERETRTAQQMAAWKKSERERVKNGKQPYFLKESTVKQLALVDEFEQLQKAGKLDHYLAKRRKRNAAKDHRYVPYARRSDQSQSQE